MMLCFAGMSWTRCRAVVTVADREFGILVSLQNYVGASDAILPVLRAGASEGYMLATAIANLSNEFSCFARLKGPNRRRRARTRCVRGDGQDRAFPDTAPGFEGASVRKAAASCLRAGLRPFRPSEFCRLGFPASDEQSAQPKTGLNWPSPTLIGIRDAAPVRNDLTLYVASRNISFSLVRRANRPQADLLLLGFNKSGGNPLGVSFLASPQDRVRNIVCEPLPR
jgi:hypothetical protein